MPRSLSRRSRLLLIVTIGVGMVHHLDHVLRVDHSGWPFRPDVTPFTYSLVAYPILLLALLGPEALRWARLAALAVLTGFTLWAHTEVETPLMQYVMWAENRSLDPATAGFQNALCIQSPTLGWAAVTVSMALNLLLVGSSLSMLWDTLKPRPVRV